ncbi:hypothetical protein LS77_009540 [Helicobacter bilis]|uniref:Lipoprotein n=2 Tax=Helicobacter bilis TaxID=37372 RepID=A0A6D2C702_9HELI|nr:hypothetical protein [Helicobacter bilis]EMZ41008.1 hypothetical protein C826_00013 [Helicobacter bilis WiWa]TLE03021.1 hypothetical protein LS77_009540 [Helicobacter bilis]TLE03766.1 hypothetical protein LS76_009685 [Helicobacter bilis]
MKKIISIMCLFVVFGCAFEIGSIISERNQLEQQHFTYELKVDALKKLGFRYCIKKFVVDDKGDVHYIIKEKLSMPLFFDDKNPDNITQFLTFVENLSTWNSKYKIDYTYKPFQCLRVYDSKEYQDEVERIVKKYCKDCE